MGARREGRGSASKGRWSCGWGRYPARVLFGDSVTVTVVVIGCVLVLVAAVIGIVRLARGKKE